MRTGEAVAAALIAVSAVLGVVIVVFPYAAAIARPADLLIIAALCLIHARLGRVWVPRSGEGPVEIMAKATKEATGAALHAAEAAADAAARATTAAETAAAAAAGRLRQHASQAAAAAQVPAPPSQPPPQPPPPPPPTTGKPRGQFDFTLK